MQRLECFLKSLTNIYLLKFSNFARVCNRLGGGDYVLKPPKEFDPLLPAEQYSPSSCLGRGETDVRCCAYYVSGALRWERWQ